VSQKQSSTRLMLYVLIAMVTSASGGLQSVNFTDWKEVTGYVLGIVATGLVTARSYIDQTPSQIIK
jgi:hypothetical protein